MRSHKDWDSRPVKAQIRRLAGMDGTVKHTSVLLFPSLECNDVRTGLDTGAFTRKTHFVVAEDQPEIYRGMVANMKQLVGVNFKPVKQFSSIKTVPTLSMAYPDFQGNMLPDDMETIRTVIVPAIKPGGSLFLTASTSTQGNTFMRILHGELPRNEAAYNKALYVVSNHISSINRRISEADRKTAAAYLLTLRLFVLKAFNFQFEVVCYRDEGCQSMLLFRIQNLQPSTEVALPPYLQASQRRIEELISIAF